jgi:hypothetical protein
MGLSSMLLIFRALLLAGLRVPEDSAQGLVVAYRFELIIKPLARVLSTRGLDIANHVRVVSIHIDIANHGHCESCDSQ